MSEVIGFPGTRFTKPEAQKSEWKHADTAPKTGDEFIARCGPEFPSFSCFWDGVNFLHYDHGEGLIAYPITEWKPFPRGN